MRNSVEVSKIAKIAVKTVIDRAKRLSIKKRSNHWLFHDLEVQKIKDFKQTKTFRSTFYFSQDGEFLIINSRMNRIDK